MGTRTFAKNEAICFNTHEILNDPVALFPAPRLRSRGDKVGVVLIGFGLVGQVILCAARRQQADRVPVRPKDNPELGKPECRWG